MHECLKAHAHKLIAKIPRRAEVESNRPWKTDHGSHGISGILHFPNSFARMLLLEFSCRRTKNSRIKNLSGQIDCGFGPRTVFLALNDLPVCLSPL